MTAKDNKQNLLGENPGTAMAKLRRMIMFDFICKDGLNTCYRCADPMTLETFSIEHIDSWMLADDPVAAFYDVSKITFSHISCNSRFSRGKHPSKHGTYNRYRAYKCRCDECTEANNKMARDYRERLKNRNAL